MDILLHAYRPWHSEPSVSFGIRLLRSGSLMGGVSAPGECHKNVRFARRNGCRPRRVRPKALARIQNHPRSTTISSSKATAAAYMCHHLFNNPESVDLAISGHKYRHGRFCQWSLRGELLDIWADFRHGE